MIWTDFFPVDLALLGLALYTVLLLILQLLTWRRLRSELAERTAQLATLQERITRLEKVSEAKEVDARVHHEEDVVELLGSLLEFNESLRGPRKGRRSEKKIDGEAS